ncbi:unnamed protein product [Thlaspi arvense]|uniref:Peptidase A1 domain-containing protein n=1 Tax=Thlaspi arvense TaxID=13288 RepID=A0AAU9SSI2_THLAR|nr:unnamed protein product [Thlaspi arvense]
MRNMRKLLNIIVILCVCLDWVRTEGSEQRESGKVYSHTIQVSSLFPSSSSCVLPSKGDYLCQCIISCFIHLKRSRRSTWRTGRARARVLAGVKLRASTMTIDEILRHDQARVNSIHSKLSKKATDGDGVTQSQSTDLPAKNGRTLGSGNYVVTVGIGTPKHDLSLVFDTGSDLTWTQCEPCRGSCYPQKEPIFNPSSSSSYSNISCSSPVCASRTSEGLLSRCSASPNCLYGIRYGDGSTTTGFFSTEKFTLTPSDVFDGVNFGCGEDNEGLFHGVAGLLGLGRGKLSFPSQTKNTYNNIFSYCLPSSPNYIGHLTFGSAGTSNAVKYTPISSFPRASLYGLGIEGITVDDQKLEIPSTVFSTPGAIIDSGTVISRLPPKAYEALRTAFKAKMSNYTAAPGRLIFDTCYDFTGLKTADIRIPRIAFSFSGGTDVELSPKGIMYTITMSQVCLAFAGNVNDDSVAVFGNTQQKTLQVVHDGAGGRVGFAPNGCN